MVIKETTDKKYLRFEPESPKERKYLETFPGLLREGLVFYCPAKKHIGYNLFTRLRKAKIEFKYTPFVKSLFESESLVDGFPEDFKFHTNPLPHQELALRFAHSYGSIGLLLEPGLGKTKVVLDFIHLRKFKRALIVCPLPLTKVWEQEAIKHRPELSTHIFESTDWNKEVSKGLFDKTVWVVNYDKATALVDALKKESIDFIGVDEGLIKNHASLRTKAITALGNNIPSRMVMSGTLINNSPLDVFAPVRFLEPSLTGRGITNFKGRYAVLAKHNPNIVFGFRDIPEIKSILQSVSIVMTKNEWLKDLPKKVFHRRVVQLSDDQRQVYTDLASDYLAPLPNGDTLEVENPLTLAMKLFQISNGFVYYKNEEDFNLKDLLGLSAKKDKPDSERLTFEFSEQPKIKELNVVADSPDLLGNRRAIIWFSLAQELSILEKALNERGESFLVIKGGEKKISEKIEKFNSDPSIRWIVCQSKTINYGVTIMGNQKEEREPDYESVYSFDPKVCDEVFYSVGFSLEMFLQQQDRIHRIGQTATCNYWLLMSNTSIENRTVDTLEKRLNCNREILEDIASSAAKDFK